MSIREQKKKKTRKAIVETAVSLFNANGYESTSIEQIARTAGIGKGTVYGYFETKRDILKGFCEYEIDKIHWELVNNVDGDAPILQQMLTIYMTEFKVVTQNREFGRLYMREAVFPNDSGKKKDEELEDKYFRLLFPILERAQQRGELRKDIELLHLTAHFYSVYILIISAWYTERITTEEAGPTMELLFTQILEGLHPANKQPRDSQ
jgi:AcrR family transcriptional regulator